MTPPSAARFRGTHSTTYTYSQPVFLQPHTIRLRPRSDPGQKVNAYSIDIDPEPAGLTSGLDAWGNSVAWAWFSGQHERLEITTIFDVERLRTNPYDFIVPNTESGSIPPAYTTEERAGLAPYLHNDDVGDDVRKLASDVATSVGNDVLEFARELAVRIQNRCEMIVRPYGDPYRGAELLSEGRGSCRDFAVLYVEACRHVGVAARFVSGYVDVDTKGDPRDLHAWAGVYLPGGGWRGFDPTQGLAVSTEHVTLAVAGVPAGAAPVTGSFAGTGATSQMDSTISFDVDPVAIG